MCSPEIRGGHARWVLIQRSTWGARRDSGGLPIRFEIFELYVRIEHGPLPVQNFEIFQRFEKLSSLGDSSSVWPWGSADRHPATGPNQGHVSRSGRRRWVRRRKRSDKEGHMCRGLTDKSTWANSEIWQLYIDLGNLMMQQKWIFKRFTQPFEKPKFQ